MRSSCCSESSPSRVPRFFASFFAILGLLRGTAGPRYHERRAAALPNIPHRRTRRCRSSLTAANATKRGQIEKGIGSLFRIGQPVGSPSRSRKRGLTPFLVRPAQRAKEREERLHGGPAVFGIHRLRGVVAHAARPAAHEE